MSAVDEREAIGTLFLGEWDLDATPMAVPNADFTPPENQGQWGRFQIIAGDSETLELGGGYTRTPGLVIVSIFTKRGIGDNLARSLCDEVVTIFRNQGVDLPSGNGCVRFREPSVKIVGVADNENYFQVNTIIPYYTDKVV